MGTQDTTQPRCGEMVERVARNLCVAVGDDPDAVARHAPAVPLWLTRVDEALAAIVSLRKLTEAMLAAGAERVRDFSPDHAPTESGKFAHPESAEHIAGEIWRAMLVVALCPPTGPVKLSEQSNTDESK